MNELLQKIYELNLSQTFYNLSGQVALSVYLIFSIFHRKKYDLSLLKTVILVLTTHFTAVYAMNSFAKIEEALLSESGRYLPKAYIYIPLIVFAISKLLKIPFGKAIDFIAPGIMLQKTIVTLGCIFTGCCDGYPFPIGIWDPYSQRIQFPVQYLESILCFVIACFLLYYEKKRGYPGDGKAYGWMLVLFGTVWLSMDLMKNNTKLFFEISSLGFHSLFMMFEGTAWLLTLEEIKIQKYNKKFS